MSEIIDFAKWKRERIEKQIHAHGTPSEPDELFDSKADEKTLGMTEKEALSAAQVIVERLETQDALIANYKEHFADACKDLSDDEVRERVRHGLENQRSYARLSGISEIQGVVERAARGLRYGPMALAYAEEYITRFSQNGAE